MRSPPEPDERPHVDETVEGKLLEVKVGIELVLLLPLAPPIGIELDHDELEYAARIVARYGGLDGEADLGLLAEVVVDAERILPLLVSPNGLFACVHAHLLEWVTDGVFNHVRTFLSKKYRLY